MIYAVIVAAGQGLRMGTATAKQFLKLGNHPIIIHTLRAFDACQEIDGIILVVSQKEIEYCRKKILPAADLKIKTNLVAGGASRQESVSNGLASIKTEKGIVLIHDGVRPLAPVELIKACIAGAKKWRACIPVVETIDTPKKINKEGIIECTVERETLKMAQTPQAFDINLIKDAYQSALKNNWQTTDDASMVEQMGILVKTIPGVKENIKITTAKDLLLANIFLDQRFEGA
ncbi:MAG: 2-C-methyl-D-erythritol 4-phosphate cytidylyltransferase [Desulfobacteraceae bacterium]|nr:2-C-methyl-D-erythritol 4-phosphate cytidylyltransferase [Desulfobacteraceae bacterium]